jgi:hypothetical protein
LQRCKNHGVFCTFASKKAQNIDQKNVEIAPLTNFDVPLQFCCICTSFQFGLFCSVNSKMAVMKNMYFNLTVFVFLGVFCSGFKAFSGPEETANQVTAALQAGNAMELAKNFNAMVDLTLPGYDDSYSKAQAGQILKDFFTQNPVKSFKVTRQGSSPDGSQYTIGSLEAGKKIFRIYFIIKSVSGQFLVQQLQVQEN